MNQMKGLEVWVLVVYHDHEPCEVYGSFMNEKDAIAWAERQCKGADAWEAKMVLDVEDEE